MVGLSKRAGNIKPSATLAITAQAKALKEKGEDVVIFGAGEPDFNPPENIKEKAIEAIEENFKGYTAAAGLPHLRKAIVKKFYRDNKIDYHASQVMASAGGKQTLYNVFQALLNKGDEVIVPVPYWVSYTEQVKLAQGEPILCETDEKMKLTADLVKEKVSKKTKAILVNSPSNPSGAVIEKKELKKLSDLALEKDFLLISDEVYEYFVYDGKEHFSPASISDEAKANTLTINSISKSFALAGWRLGYCGGPEELIKAMTALQSHATSNPCSISQAAAIEGLTQGFSGIKAIVSEFDQRRLYLVKRLNEMNGVNCLKPEGAFYCYPDISASGLSSQEFCKQLLEKEKVAVIPGDAFGTEGFIRISYALEMEKIVEGMKRLERFCKQLK
jgi:aspartate aminotransferase